MDNADFLYTLLKNVGLPGTILFLVLYRVDHYIKHLFSTFGDISASLDNLTSEIKNIKYYIHAKEPPRENH